MQGAADAGVRVAVLVTGAQGSGRSTAVQAAAAALGVQVLPFSGLELRGAGQGEAHVAAALRSAFSAAADYAPAILLLTQAASLTDAPPGQGPGAPSSSPPSPRAASSLCTRTLLLQRAQEGREGLPLYRNRVPLYVPLSVDFVCYRSYLPCTQHGSAPLGEFRGNAELQRFPPTILGICTAGAQALSQDHAAGLGVSPAPETPPCISRNTWLMKHPDGDVLPTFFSSILRTRGAKRRRKRSVTNIFTNVSFVCGIMQFVI